MDGKEGNCGACELERKLVQGKSALGRVPKAAARV